MRIRVPARRIVIFSAMFVAALVAFLPLRVVMGAVDSGIDAREASGSVWAGHLKEARIGPAVLGDLNARLSPLRLLTGQATIRVERPGAAPDRFSGAFGVSRNSRSAESVTGNIPLETGLGPIPVSSLDLTGVTIRFRDGACQDASGAVRANLSGGTAGLALPATLSGAVRCDRGALLLPLKSGSGAESLSLRIDADGRYEADMRVQTSDPVMAARLTGAGFAIGPGGYEATMRRKF